MAPPIISSTGYDLNGDGKYNRWDINMRVKRPSATMVLQTVNLITAWDYQTSGEVNMQMEGLVHAQVSVPKTDGTSAKLI